MSTTQVVIVGGHGKVALRLAKLLANTNKHSVTSIVRNEDHVPDLKAVSSAIHPLVLSLEDGPVSEFAKAFTGKDVVVFAAGSGGKGGVEGLVKIDYEGALKVFDAIEAVEGNKPRLVLVSAVDSRDTDGSIPSHYSEVDIETSKQMRVSIGKYMEMKYLADKNLSKRTTFKWSIIRPGFYDDEPGTGKATIGRTHIAPSISRDDVALALSILIDRPDAAGLAVDMVGGDTSITEGLDAFIARGETDFLG
ncbi:NAD(P)-binding protein [Peniophora sp. CONT]|nr:NAD(P)-binding protein [Peniophora sp. CONT]